jgi:predicted RecB family endonuclease
VGYSMANAGKQFEKLVSTIEQILLPKGLKVLANERVYSDEGVQIAKIDIEIKSKF